MYIDYTEEQEELRRELRDYFSKLMTPEVRESLNVEGGGDSGPDNTYRRIIRQMGEDGWLGIGWPEEYGGQNRSMVDQLIFSDEASIAGVPLPSLTIGTIGPALMTYGTDAQRKHYLPGILEGRIHFSIGYSEPEAGTDLASVTTRAVRDGDQYVINGQKMWTSLIEHADYVWLAVRTNPEEKRHKGLSLIIVPTDTPGFSYTPVRTVGGAYTSATYYEDVHVPVENLVGEENGGWPVITGQLNHERVSLFSSAGMQRHLAETIEWAKETKLRDGRRVIDQEWVQVHLARVRSKVEFLKLINWKIAWGAHNGVNPAAASATKVFGSELNLEASRLLMEVLGQHAYVLEGSPGARVYGRLERTYRSTIILTFGGGANEVQRDMIAMKGLGMPRGR